MTEGLSTPSLGITSGATAIHITLVCTIGPFHARQAALKIPPTSKVDKPERKRNSETIPHSGSDRNENGGGCD
jgi:hypothetical protein